MSVLTTAGVMAFVATAKPAQARAFYEGVLGLTFMEDSPFALVFDLDGTVLRIHKMDRVAPTPYTALGWQVSNIWEAVRELTDAGVTFERFENMPQDSMGVWATPDGSAVAWFKDPDGNMLSLAQLSAPEVEVSPLC
jgi:catechol 2,3-dioxygenase-like lactoylglutathione lyase family enzyme